MRVLKPTADRAQSGPKPLETGRRAVQSRSVLKKGAYTTQIRIARARGEPIAPAAARPPARTSARTSARTGARPARGGGRAGPPLVEGLTAAGGQGGGDPPPGNSLPSQPLAQVLFPLLGALAALALGAAEELGQF